MMFLVLSTLFLSQLVVRFAVLMSFKYLLYALNAILDLHFPRLFL